MARTLTPQELDELARVLMSEAAGEGYSGMSDVASVIRNRMRSSRFPDDPLDVVRQPRQFSGVNDGGNIPYNQGASSPAYDDAVRAVNSVIMGDAPDNTGGATHYYAPGAMPGGRAPYWQADEMRRQGAVAMDKGAHRFLSRLPNENAPIPEPRPYMEAGAGRGMTSGGPRIDGSPAFNGEPPKPPAIQAAERMMAGGNVPVPTPAPRNMQVASNSPNVPLPQGVGNAMQTGNAPKVAFELAGKQRSQIPSSGIVDKVARAAQSVDPSLTTQLFSGQEPPGAPPAGTPDRHPRGYAGDFRFLDESGLPISDNTRLQDIAMKMAADHKANIGYSGDNSYMSPTGMHIDTMPLDQYPGGPQWGNRAKSPQWRNTLDYARATGVGPTPYRNAPVPEPRPNTEVGPGRGMTSGGPRIEPAVPTTPPAQRPPQPDGGAMVAQNTIPMPQRPQSVPTAPQQRMAAGPNIPGTFPQRGATNVPTSAPSPTPRPATQMAQMGGSAGSVGPRPTMPNPSMPGSMPPAQPGIQRGQMAAQAAPAAPQAPQPQTRVTQVASSPTGAPNVQPVNPTNRPGNPQIAQAPVPSPQQTRTATVGGPPSQNNQPNVTPQSQGAPPSMQQSLADSMANAPSMDPPDFDVGAKPGGLFAGLSDAIGPKGAKGFSGAGSAMAAAAESMAKAQPRRVQRPQAPSTFSHASGAAPIGSVVSGGKMASLPVSPDDPRWNAYINALRA